MYIAFKACLFWINWHACYSCSNIDNLIGATSLNKALVYWMNIYLHAMMKTNIFNWILTARNLIKLMFWPWSPNATFGNTNCIVPAVTPSAINPAAFCTFQGSDRLHIAVKGKLSGQKICSYLDIVKITLTPPPLSLFSWTIIGNFFKDKKVTKRKIYNVQI